MGLFVYVAVRNDHTGIYQSSWEQWLRQHFPSWAFVDLDNQSDPSFISYVQQAVNEHTRIIVMIELKTNSNAPLGSAFTLLQRLAREQSDQTILLLQGEHPVLEKMGKAFRLFYQTTSRGETEQQLTQILEVD
ncbi:MAG: hypothetical protein AAF992_17800 [Bacteroidota bacterium]